MKKIEKIIVKCFFCNKEKQIYPCLNDDRKHFCNKECKNLYQKGKKLSEEIRKKISISTKGEKNGNFGKRWSIDQRIRSSEISKNRFADSEMRYKAGSANRGKKFSEEKIFAMHGYRKYYSKVIHTIETKKKISEASKKKFTKEFKEKLRKTNEELGYWTPLKDKSDKEIYYIQSNWKENMWNFISSSEEKLLLKELGVFNSRKNSKGVVRDHSYSRHSGFINSVFPEILRHPANLKILTNSSNIKKRQCKNIYIDDNSQSLIELFDKIRSYPLYWKEQEICLSLIKAYENGERWNRNTY